MFIPSKLRKDVKKRADDLIVLGPIGEMFDGLAIGVLLAFLDDNYGDKIPEQFQDEIILLLQAFAYQQYDLISEATVSLIDEFVDLPFADEDFTAKWVALNVQMLDKFVRHLASK